jgi:hypothetical protein
MERGSRSYISPVEGSSTSQNTAMVVWAKNGSMWALAGIGHQRHVEASMPFQPAIEEPSKAIAVREHGLVDARAVGRDVLHLALGVGEAQVKKLDLLVLHHLQYVANGLRSSAHWLLPVLTQWSAVARGWAGKVCRSDCLVRFSLVGCEWPPRSWR